MDSKPSKWVDGKSVEMTDAEIADLEADWAAGAAEKTQRSADEYLAAVAKVQMSVDWTALKKCLDDWDGLKPEDKDAAIKLMLSYVTRLGL